MYLSGGGEERRMKNRQREAPASAPLELGEFLCFAVYSASHAFNRVYAPLLAKFGLTYPQFIAMILLWARDGQTVGELGRELFLQSNTLTPMLKRLEALGLVTRTRDAADERQVRVKLTAAGKKLRVQATDVIACIRDATGLQDTQARELVKEITTLREALERRSS